MVLHCTSPVDQKSILNFNTRFSSDQDNPDILNHQSLHTADIGAAAGHPPDTNNVMFREYRVTSENLHKVKVGKPTKTLFASICDLPIVLSVDWSAQLSGNDHLT